MVDVDWVVGSAFSIEVVATFDSVVMAALG
jgi:hypothetical protein